MSDNRNEADRIAAEVVERLFVNGNGQRAGRLVLYSEPGRNLGGWCEGAVRDQVADAISNRLSHLETLVSRLPHVWHRREGEWVRVAVVVGMTLWLRGPEFTNDGREIHIDYIRRADNGQFFLAGWHESWCYLTRADAIHAQHDPPTERDSDE